MYVCMYACMYVYARVYVCMYVCMYVYMYVCMLAVLVWRCLLGSAPGYLCELCRPVYGLPGRRALRSSANGQLLVPRAKTATTQRRAFSIVGPSTWNGFPLEIRILPKNNESSFCRLLKTDLYRRGWAGGASE